ncbi:EAL domain-containing protein [Thalassotalea maritima]|uniref:EAL domain-containing protein n=1 Tax=Thalassotalea maritima TaxID=3242416 RepID=UPI0035284EB5
MSQTLIKLQQYSINEGLSENTVFSITQDRQGFIWLATLDGLNRFDGYEFITYKSHATNSNSLPSDIIRVLFIDSNDKLWVGTQSGLVTYDVTTDSFHTVDTQFENQTIWSIFEDANNNILVSTNDGVYRQQKDDINFSKLSFRQYTNDIVEVKSIYQDQQGNYWFGTYENGLFISNEQLSFIFSAQQPNRFDLSVPETTIYEINLIDSNTWLATNNGVYVIDKDWQLQQHIKPPTADAHRANHIRTIEKANDIEVFLGTEAGLYVYDMVTKRITAKKTKRVDSSQLNIDFIYDLFIDQAGSLWLATSTAGANKFSANSSLFSQAMTDRDIQKNVIGFSQVNKNGLFIATESHGIYYQDFYSNTIERLPIDLPPTILSITSGTQNDLILMTTDYEIYRVNINTWHVDNLWNIDSKSLTGLNRVDFQFSQGSIFHGSNDGVLIEYDIYTGQKTTYEIPADSSSFYMLSSNNDTSVFISGEQGELLSFDTLNRSFSHYNLKSHPVFHKKTLASISDTPNYMWFSFWGDGVLLLDKQTSEYTQFNSQSGLANDYVLSLLVDINFNAWVATNKGISKISAKQRKVDNFDHFFGVQKQQFWIMSAFKASNGRYYFGSLNGFNSFYPEDILPHNNVVLAPVNTKLLIANKEQTDLVAPLFELDSITLEYNQSPFTIEFSSPNASITEQTLYRYKLVGVDDKWIETNSAHRRATYTNLDAGDYTFMVQAYDQSQVDYQQSRDLTISILPPWWLSNSARFAYALVFLLICYYLYRQALNKQQINAMVRQSEERLKLALWGSGDEMWDWNIVTNRMYRSNIWGVLNFPIQNTTNNESELNDQQRNIHPQDRERVQQVLQQHKDGITEHYEATYRVRNKFNEWMWVLDRGKVVERNADDQPIRMTGTLKDISQIKANEESLKLFAKCIANISDGVVVFDADFVIIDCNAAYEKITGQEKEFALGSSLEFSNYPQTFTQSIKTSLQQHGTWQGEVQSTRVNGKPYLIDITMDVIRDEHHAISHYVAIFSDITRRKKTEQELRRLANSDTLTGLPNRSFFQSYHEQLINQEQHHTLLVLDLDNFKKINDSLGHQVGDSLLCNSAERISQISGIKDTFYRLGGDEFALIIKTNDIHKITATANKILKTIIAPHGIDLHEISLSCSIGIAMFPDDGINTHELLKNADTAMYHAKDHGGDNYQFFSDAMNKQAVKRLQIENLIRHGLKEDMFSVFYQPKIDVNTGGVVGMEALVRFDAGDKGIIRPDIFIPISEETGQIIEIGELVLRKACIATKAWLDQGIFNGRLAVNLSAVQFKQSDLVATINGILEETGLPAEHLELEITEGTVMNSPQQAIATMQQIRHMGIHLSLDDFGTGYSSLAHLKQFPLNTLKIDKAFIDDIEASEQGRNMVATIITIAHNLGMSVVAEGVETATQLSYLKTLQCEQMQGYLYSKPLAEEYFERYLLSHIITTQSAPFMDT